MRRRWAGVHLVGVALAAALIASRAHSSLVAGVAATTPAPGAPTVGDCILQPFADGDGWSDPGGVYPPLRTGVCAGRRYGEVVAVVADGLTNYSAASQTAANPSNGIQDTNPLVNTCGNKIAEYVGIVPTRGTVPALFQIWYPPGVPATAVIGPSARRKAAGQTWLACSYRFPTTQAGSASLKSEFTNGTVPGVFARCRTSVDPTYPTYAPVACDLAHPVEEFGVETKPATAAQRESTCDQLVHRLTGMADPTDGGRLQIRVLMTPQVLKAAEPIYCVLAAAGSRALDGPLLGLGSGPVPWTN